MEFVHGSLFSGIGGFDYAAQKMGWKNEFHCEINSFCLKVLKKNFPDSITYEDITKTDFTIHRGRIDILTGGFPCQPFSQAGKMQGKDDERYLWPEYLRAIREIKPRFVLGENVSGLLTTNGGKEFENIMLSLETEGYETLPILLPACSIGAQHIRERIWIIGRDKMESDTNSQRGQLGKISDTIEAKRSQHRIELSGNAVGFHWYETISGIHGKLNGLSRRLDGRRNAALGNAIHPGVALEIFKAIEQTFLKCNDPTLRDEVIHN